MCLRLNQVRQFPSVSNRRNGLYLKSVFPSSKLPQTRQRSIVTSGSLQVYIKTFVVYFFLRDSFVWKFFRNHVSNWRRIARKVSRKSQASFSLSISFNSSCLKSERPQLLSRAAVWLRCARSPILRHFGIVAGKNGMHFFLRFQKDIMTEKQRRDRTDETTQRSARSVKSKNSIDIVDWLRRRIGGL